MYGFHQVSRELTPQQSHVITETQNNDNRVVLILKKKSARSDGRSGFEVSQPSEAANADTCDSDDLSDLEKVVCLPPWLGANVPELE